MLRGRCASTSYDVDDTIRSFDDFFFFFTEEKSICYCLFILLFYLFFSFRLFIYVYIYCTFFFPFWKKRRFSFQSGEGRRLCTISSRCADASPVFSSFSVSINLSLSLFLSLFTRTSLNALFHSVSLSLSFYIHIHIYMCVCIFGSTTAYIMPLSFIRERIRQCNQQLTLTHIIQQQIF